MSRRIKAQRPGCRRAARPRLELLEGRLAPAVFKVPSSAIPDFAGRALTAAIAVAASNSDPVNAIVLEAGTYQVSDQLITDLDNSLPNKTLTILGQNYLPEGSNVVTERTFITSGLNGRVFHVVDTNVTFQNLTIKEGKVEALSRGELAMGGGLLLEQANVTLQEVVVSQCQAFGANGADGGSGARGETGGAAYGGGITLLSGSLTLSRSVIEQNVVMGGLGGRGGDGGEPSGPGEAPGAQGGQGGVAFGGGLYVGEGTLEIDTRTSIRNNQARGGNGGSGGAAAASDLLSHSGDGGWGGEAGGGGVYVGRRPAGSGTGDAALAPTISDAFFEDNTAVGGKGGDGGGGDHPGAGGSGGRGSGGGVAFDTLSSVSFVGEMRVVNSAFKGNVAGGGEGGKGDPYDGAGGAAEGGGTFVTGGVVFASSVFDHNRALGGVGGPQRSESQGPVGTGGSAHGGALYVLFGPARLFDTTMTNCSAVGGAGGGVLGAGSAWGGGLFADGARVSFVGGGALSNSAAGGTGSEGLRAGDAGGPGGSASGGAMAAAHLSTSEPGSLSVVNAVLADNSTAAGAGGKGEANVREDGVGGDGGGGGWASGGTIYADSFLGLYNTTLTHSSANAGAGGPGGEGGLRGGDGGDGGWALGGAYYSSPGETVLVGSLADGSAEPMPGGAGGAGPVPGWPGESGEAVEDPTPEGAVPGPATRLLVSPLPDTLIANNLLPSLYVLAVDADGRVVPTFNGEVTVTLLDPDLEPVPGHLRGTTSVAARYGVAVFTDLKIDLGAQGLHLGVTSSGLASADSDWFGVSGYSPAQVRGAYGLTRLAELEGDLGYSPDGAGQTIAIIGFYRHPTVDSDLDVFSQAFGRTDTGPSFFDEYGAADTYLDVVSLTTEVAPPKSQWPGEVAMDVQWAHAMAPKARILLVECEPSLAGYMAGVDYVNDHPELGVSVVSMSAGWSEAGAYDYRGTTISEDEEALYNPYFATPGVTFFAASGDKGIVDASYPAFSPNVIAVGGTTVTLYDPDDPNPYPVEVAWAESGGGLSLFQPEPSYQIMVTPDDGARSIPDVSFLGDPSTGVWLYVSAGDDPGWEVSAGTSLGAPAWAGLMAVVNQGRQHEGVAPLSSAETLKAIYAIADHFPDQDFRDVTEGHNGGYAAGPGYDLVTGVGSPEVLKLIPHLVNWGPGLTPWPLTTGTAGVPYADYVFSFRGIGRHTLTYRVVEGAIPDGLTIAGAGGYGTFLHVFGTPTEAGTAVLEVTVTDELGGSATRNYTLAVNPAPSLVITTTTLPDWTVGAPDYFEVITTAGGTEPVQFVVTGGDLPDGLELSEVGVVLGTPTMVGTYDFTVTATDRAGRSDDQAYRVVINPAVSLSPAALPPAVVGVAFGQAIVAGGGTGDKGMAFTITAGAIPEGLVFETVANQLLIYGAAAELGFVNFTVTATDEVGATATWDYYLETALYLVDLTPASIPAGTAGANYFQVITASGGIGDKSMTVVVTGAIPAGMTLEAVYNTVTLAGVPTEAASMPFTVIATDAVGTWASQDYTLTVNPALAITTAWLPDWTVWKDGYHATIETAGGTAPVRFAVTEGSLPNGLTLHTSTGLIDGTPDDSGTFGFTVAATDAAGATASRDYTVYIKPRVNFASKGLPDWTAGAAGYYGDASATGGTGPLVYTLTAGALPPGLRLDETAGVLTGTPAAAGAFDFTLTATDSVGASGTKDYAVVINPAVTLAPGAVAPAAAGVAYEQAISAGGGTGLKALRYAVTAGALPAGLAIVVAGERLTLGGTPLEGGAFTFEVTATDTVGASLTRAYSLSVNGRPVLAPVADLFVDEGQTLTRTLSAADDPAQKLTFALVSGPAGLAVDADTGALSWATTDGPLTAPVTVRVTDDAAVPLSDVVTFTVTVRNVAPSATFAAPATAAVGAPATFRFTAPADVPADLDAGLWYSFDLDGDGTFEVANSALPDAAFTYLAPGSYTARGRVADKDGDYSEYSALVIAEAVAPAPTVVGVVVNDGGGQRSMVTSLTVTFSERVTFVGDPRAAFLLRRAGGASVELAVALTVLDGKTVAVLTFTGDDVVAGSLADGRYELTVVADQVVGAGGGRLGQDRKESVARYFGDLNGDGTVDLAELGVARSRLGSQRGDANYLWYLDYNNDGRIDSADYGEVRRRYGRGL